MNLLCKKFSIEKLDSVNLRPQQWFTTLSQHLVLVLVFYSVSVRANVNECLCGAQLYVWQNCHKAENCVLLSMLIGYCSPCQFGTLHAALFVQNFDPAVGRDPACHSGGSCMWRTTLKF